MKILPETVCFQPLSVAEGKSRGAQGWKQEMRKETDRENTGKWNCKMNLDVVQSEWFRRLCLHCLAMKMMRKRLAWKGKMGQGFLFFCYWKTTKEKNLKQKLKRKHSGGLQGGDTGPFLRKMCVSVSTLIGKNVPWSLIFHCRTSIDGSKNNLWDV